MSTGEGALLENAFAPLGHRGGWFNSPDLHTSAKPSIEMGAATMSPRLPVDPMRFNGANMVPPPGHEGYRDVRHGPSTLSQPLDMTDPMVRQVAAKIIQDLDAKGMLSRPGVPGAGSEPVITLDTPSGEVVENFGLKDAKSKLEELMGNSAFVIGVFIFVFGNVIKNMALIVVGAVFLGVPGAMSVVRSAGEYLLKESGLQQRHASR